MQALKRWLARRRKNAALRAVQRAEEEFAQLKPRDHVLSEIPVERWQRLKKEVEAANGKAIVLVHPFFPLSKGHDANYITTVLRLLKQRKTPVIILEETAGIRALKDRLLRMRAPRGHLVIATVPLSSSPAFGLTKSLAGENYSVLASKLKATGIKTLYIGGRLTYLAYGLHTPHAEYERKVLGKESDYQVASGCAGTAYRMLAESGEFKVRPLTSAMQPYRPKWSAERNLKPSQPLERLPRELKAYR